MAVFKITIENMKKQKLEKKTSKNQDECLFVSTSHHTYCDNIKWHSSCTNTHKHTQTNKCKHKHVEGLVTNNTRNPKQYVNTNEKMRHQHKCAFYNKRSRPSFMFHTHSKKSLQKKCCLN